MDELRVRFAPSPTGFLHIGGARTALYNWLIAKQKKGKFILRIEDTDVERSNTASIDAILDGLKWLGLDWNEGPDKGGEYGPYFQSQRKNTYQKYVDKLINENKAFYCFCTQEELEAKKKLAVKKKAQYKYDGKCRDLKKTEVEKKLIEKQPFVIRLKIDLKENIVFKDLIKGEIAIHSDTIDDFIIVRSDGTPIYNFAVVMDDALMKMNIIIRGDDHISNTPKQILIYQALEFPIPQFAHVPMILGEDKTRLSKRHGATAVQQYRDEGFLSEAVVNYLARLGWGYDDTQEIFSIKELIKKFTLERVSKNPAIFNYKKLEWLNSYYIQQLNLNDRTKAIIPFLIKQKLIVEADVEKQFEFIKKIVEIIGDRLKTLTDIIPYGDYFFKNKIEFDQETIDKLFLKIDLKDVYKQLNESLKKINNWDKETILKELEILAPIINIKRKDFFQAIRAALTGRLNSPDLMDIMLIMGKDKVINKVENTIDFLENLSLQKKN